MDWETRDRIERENQRRQDQIDRMRAEGERIKEHQRQMRQDVEDRQRHNELIRTMRASGGGSGGGGSSMSTTGTAVLLGLLFAAWLFVTFAPWVLGIGGALLLGIGGKKLMEVTFPQHRDGIFQSIFALILAVIAGAIGVNKGLEIQKEYGSSQDQTPSESSPAPTSNDLK